MTGTLDGRVAFVTGGRGGAVGHPFNPPHLIPLVEVLGNEHTDPGVEAARRFYESVGKITIAMRREVPGHVANRLQAALWREAIHLVLEGVATVDDVDTDVGRARVCAGRRWDRRRCSISGRRGWVASFCERSAASFDRWWDDLGELHFTDDVATELIRQQDDAIGERTTDDLAAERDALVTAMLRAAAPIRSCSRPT